MGGLCEIHYLKTIKKWIKKIKDEIKNVLQSINICKKLYKKNVDNFFVKSVLHIINQSIT